MEQWKDVKGYEEYYEVSDLGRIRNKKRNRLVNPYPDSRGYLSVELGYIGKKKVRMHQLIMQTFKPEGYFEGADVDHKDGNKHNNVLTNLEYVTHAENVERHYRKKNKKVMIGVSPEGKEYEFTVISPFAREHGLQFQHVSRCLMGRLPQHKGWTFRYKGEQG